MLCEAMQVGAEGEDELAAQPKVVTAADSCITARVVGLRPSGTQCRISRVRRLDRRNVLKERG